MIAAPSLQWTYTFVFAAVAAYFAHRAWRARRNPAEAVEHALHVAMAAVMAAMAWPWWGSWPRPIQIVFFVGATVWFLIMALMHVVGSAPPSRHGRFAVLYRSSHAVMMAAMVWMIAVMPAGDDGEHGGVYAGGVHAGGVQDGAAGMLSAAAFRSGTILTAALLMAALVELVLFLRRTTETPEERHQPHGESGGAIVMLLGMAAPCLSLLAA